MYEMLKTKNEKKVIKREQENRENYDVCLLYFKTLPLES